MNLLEETISETGLTIKTLVNGKEQMIPYEALSRHVTTMLQKGDKQEIDAWKFVRTITLEECNRIYKKLSVTLTDEDIRGESEYKDDLPNVVAELKKKGLAVESEGAVCVFPEGFKDKEGKPCR